MSQRRYNTVHDLAALRLHPDGSRVSTSSVQNVRPRGAKHVTQDARGNWIARDAGGLGRVKKRRRRKGKGKMRRDESVQDEEGAALDSAEGSATDEGEEAGSGLKGRESKKRRTFLGGFDYLNPESSKGSLQHLTDASYVQGSSANDGAASPSSPPLSVPSSVSANIYPCDEFSSKNSNFLGPP